MKSKTEKKNKSVAKIQKLKDCNLSFAMLESKARCIIQILQWNMEGKKRDNLINTDANSQNHSSCTEMSFAPGTGGVSHASSVPQHRCSCCTTSYV